MSETFPTDPSTPAPEGAPAEATPEAPAEAPAEATPEASPGEQAVAAGDAGKKGGGPATAIGCIVGALVALVTPLGLAAYLISLQFATDGDAVRDLGPEVEYIGLQSPESAVSSNTMYMGSYDEPLEFGSDTGGATHLYLRFPIDLPVDARVRAADVILRCDNNFEGSGTQATTAVIEMLDSGDQPPFSPGRYRDADDLQDIDERVEGSVRWGVDPWVGGETYATPDLSHLIQEFIARPDYRSRNAIGLRIRGEGEAPQGALDRSYLRSVAPLGSGDGPTLRLVIDFEE